MRKSHFGKVFIVLLILTGCVLWLYNYCNSPIVITILKFEDRDIDVEKNVMIEYPQIQIENKELEAKINTILYDAALNDYQSHWEQNGLVLERTCEIAYVNETMISIVFKEYNTYTDGMIHPINDCYAVTISIKNGEIEPYTKFLDKEEIIKKIKNQEFIVKSIASETSIPENISLEELGDRFLMQSGSNKTNKNNFFFGKNGKVNLIIYLFSGMGYYTIIEMQ